MKTLVDSMVPVGSKRPLQLFKMLPAALGNVPFHEDTPSITRYFAENFPVHVAVHKVSPVMSAPKEYTQLHVHDDSDEVNIIISQNNLRFKVKLEDEEFIAENNSCVWIPRGTWHSANVLRGSGYFITLRIH